MKAAPEGVAMFGKPEDLYSADEKELERLDSAWAKSALGLRTGMRYGHQSGSLRCQSLVAVHERLEVFRKRFENGNTFALLSAISLCAEENLPLPTWLAVAYSAALESFQTLGGPASLDKVFFNQTIPTTTPEKAEKAKRDWKIGQWLWSRAWRVAISDESVTSLDGLVFLVLKDSPPDDAPWRQWPVKKTKAKELIVMIDENQVELLNWPQSKALSSFLEKRRKR